MVMIDTHCHLTYRGLDERAEQVVADAGAAGVDRMISVGTSLSDSQRAVAMAERFDNVFASVGVHPHHADEVADTVELDVLRELAGHGKVVAFGEMGLDYFHAQPDPTAQQRVFDAQLAVVADIALPVIIHNRKATDDTLRTLQGSGLDPARFVFHCFTGTREELEAILAFGAMVSFTGIVTFGNATDIAEATDIVPIERMMIETDSPYLTPAPHRKVRPNEPKYVALVAEFLAARRGMDVDAFVAVMDANADRFFGLR